MKILLPIAIIVSFILVYALWGRDWLKKQSWAQGFFAVIEPVELVLFKKSQTILFARSLSALGAVLTVLTQLGSIDITPIMPLVPDQYEGAVRMVWNLLPLLITGLGMIVERLRNQTTKPLELVAIPEAKITPEVAETIAVADMAKAEAVAAVKAA